MQKINNPYLLRKLEEGNSFFASSFSNRYCNWKRRRTIEQALLKELKYRSAQKDVLRVLEIGCGDGWLIYRMKSVFDKTFRLYFTGVDISELDIDFANNRKEYFGHKGCEFMVMDANKLNFEDETFDIVISSEVIEHIKRPADFMLGLRRILRSGGLAIITTPNGGGGIFAKFSSFLNIFSFGAVRKSRKKLELSLISDNERNLSKFSSSGGFTGAGLDHISVKSVSGWKMLFKENCFTIQSVIGTAGLLFGDPFLDKHRVIFAFSVILDAIIDHLPFSYFFSECLCFELRKV